MEQQIFCGHSIEEVAQKFSEIIARNYEQHLEFWRWNATGKEIYKWRKKLKEEPQIVRENAYKKILKIMQSKKEYEEYYKTRWLIFTDNNVIDITKDSNFYKDLIPDEDISSSVQVSHKYRIDRKRFIIAKRL